MSALSSRTINLLVLTASLLAGALVLALVSLALELPMQRFAHPSYPFVHRHTPNVTWTRVGFGDLALARPHDRQLRPISWSTDSHGFRANVAATELDSPIEVLALGDSFTAGGPNTQRDFWPQQLGSLSGRAVYNMGHPAEGPWHGLMNLLIERPRLRFAERAWVVLAVFSGNDLDNRVGALELPPALEQTPLRGARRFFEARVARFPFTQAWRRYRHTRDVGDRVRAHPWIGDTPMLFLDRYQRRSKRTRADLLAHSNHAGFGATLHAIEAFTATNGLSLLIALYPPKGEVYSWVANPGTAPGVPASPSPFALMLGELSETIGARFVDLTPALAEAAVARHASGASPVWWLDDTHPNRVGHCVSARAIAQALAFPLLSDCSTDVRR